MKGRMEKSKDTVRERTNITNSRVAGDGLE